MPQFLVHGITRSFFTRKVTGYLDHTNRPWRLDAGDVSPSTALQAGWNGGIPVVTTPEGVPIWDSTSIIEHLDVSTDPALQVIPTDPLLRFLAYFLDDLNDEWFYRPAVGSRWSFIENSQFAGWHIAEELSIGGRRPAADLQAKITTAMSASMVRLGVTADNISDWMGEVLVGWLETLQPHLSNYPYLLGHRPSLADFAIFGANAAHFIGDPYCRAIVERHAPAVVEHTHRLQRPAHAPQGDWISPTEIPDSLIAVLAYAGRHYLPWLIEATTSSQPADVAFASGTSAAITSTPFLNTARGVMVARYLDDRTAELDSVLDQAGVLHFYSEHRDQATAAPNPLAPPQPSDNRPYRAMQSRLTTIII